jgi:hypothetical protein
VMRKATLTVNQIEKQLLYIGTEFSARICVAKTSKKQHLLGGCKKGLRYSTNNRFPVCYSTTYMNESSEGKFSLTMTGMAFHTKKPFQVFNQP